MKTLAIFAVLILIANSASSQNQKELDRQVPEQFLVSPTNENDSIILLIQSYYACKTWQDRLNYVLRPEEIKSYMEKYYSPYRSTTIRKDEVFVQGAGFKTNQVFKVIVEHSDWSFVFYIKKLQSSYKIDWLATTGYNPISLNTFKANLSSTPTEFHLLACLDSYYNFNYRNAQNSFWSITIHDPDELHINGYISKSTNEGKKLYNILKDGYKLHPVILEIRIDTTDDKWGRTVLITKVIADGWSWE